jgi:hypothetical protein
MGSDAVFCMNVVLANNNITGVPFIVLPSSVECSVHFKPCKWKQGYAYACQLVAEVQCTNTELQQTFEPGQFLVGMVVSRQYRLTGDFSFSLFSFRGNTQASILFQLDRSI